MLPWRWLICPSLSAQWLQFKPLRSRGIGWTETFWLAKECIQMDSENKYSMITLNMIEFQKLHLGMWTSYQPIGRVFEIRPFGLYSTSASPSLWPSRKGANSYPIIIGSTLLMFYMITERIQAWWVPVFTQTRNWSALVVLLKWT